LSQSLSTLAALIEKKISGIGLKKISAIFLFSARPLIEAES
jgi:hypothetical protein